VIILDVLQKFVEAKNSFASFLPADPADPMLGVVRVTRRIA
jgi:hypothetical protein